MITIIDTRPSNLRSVLRALEYLNHDCRLATSPADLMTADRIIIPGVGAFPDGIRALRSNGFVEPLQTMAAKGTPILGICLGMQMLMNTSEEGGGKCRGLGLIPGTVVRLKPSESRDRVPNVGWCDVALSDRFSIAVGLPSPSSFYFTHSYVVECQDSVDSVGEFNFGGSLVTAAIQRGSIFGVQFHAEKSQDSGLHLLDNFAKFKPTLNL